MKLCGRKKMSQRSSILWVLAVFMIVFVDNANGSFVDNIISETTTEEPPILTSIITPTPLTSPISSQQIIDTVNNIVSDQVDLQKEQNETQEFHDLDIQINFIDSDLKNHANDEDNDFGETHTEEPIVIDLGQEFQNTTLTTQIDNATVFLDDIENPEVQSLVPENKETSNKINESQSNLEESAEEENVVPLETTTLPNLNQIITTVAPVEEDTPTTHKAIESTTLHFQETTPSIKINENTRNTPSDHLEKVQDLSIFFESEPSQARQLRGSNKENENEITAPIPLGSESESNSNIPKSLESELDYLSVSSDSLPGHDENHVAEDSSLPENESIENSVEIEDANDKHSMTSHSDLNVSPTALPKTLLTDVVNEEPNKPVNFNPIDEIEAVTESTGETSNDVRIIGVEGIHSVIKKPGFDNEISSSGNNTDELIQESTNRLSVTDPNNEADSVVNFVLNRTKEVLELSSIPKVVETSSVDNQVLNIVDSNQNTTKKMEDISQAFPSTTTETSNSRIAQGPEFENHTETKSLPEPEVLDKDKSENKINYVQLNIDTPSDQQDNQLQLNEEKSLPDLQSSLIPHPENVSIKVNDQHVYEMNAIPISEEQDEKSHDDIEYPTEATPVKSNDASLTEDVQEDQTSKVESGIFKETELPNFTELAKPKLNEEAVTKFTENPVDRKIENTTTAPLGKNYFETTKDYARRVDSLQTMRDETGSAMSDEVIAPASVGRSFNEIVAEGLGKPLPTRSVGDEPSSSSYSSEDKTTTVLVLCAAAGGIFIAFSVAIYLITFQRQNGTLDIEMQEQRCGKDNLDDDDDSETRVSLLNQQPTVDSDEHSSD